MTSGQKPSAHTLLERGVSELGGAGLTDARIQAELLLRHALGVSRASLFAHLHEPVTPEAAGLYFQLVERRRGRVPIQYVLGTQEFYGLGFRVTPAVLIPRPETEGIVDEALRVLRHHAAPRIADVGSGSGCIAVALAHELPRATVLAVDTSAPALAVARENALTHGVAERVRLFEGDLLAPVRKDAGGLLDAVVSNPPYIPDSELGELEPEVAGHEPQAALRGGIDGLAVIARLLPQAAELLKPGGRFLMEIGKGQDSAVKTLVERAGLEPLATLPDLAGIPRVVRARRPGGGSDGTEDADG